MGYPGNWKNSLNYDQRIALIMINFLGDPSLVILFMKVLSQVALESARDFHISLRNSYPGSNHPQVGVPLTCDLPITAEQWRRGRELMRTINYTHTGFLQIDPSYPNIGIEPFIEVDTCNDYRVFWKRTIIELYMEKSIWFKKKVEQSYLEFRDICDKYDMDTMETVDLPDDEYNIIQFLCLSRSETGDESGDYPLDNLELIL